jgi:hypothetical protein
MLTRAARSSKAEAAAGCDRDAHANFPIGLNLLPLRDSISRTIFRIAGLSASIARSYTPYALRTDVVCMTSLSKVWRGDPALGSRARRGFAVRWVIVGEGQRQGSCLAVSRPGSPQFLRHQHEALVSPNRSRLPRSVLPKRVLAWYVSRYERRGSHAEQRTSARGQDLPHHRRA